MDEIDLSEWTKKPPPRAPSPVTDSPIGSQHDNAKVRSSSSERSEPPSPASSTNASSDLGDIFHDENPPVSGLKARAQSPQDASSDSSDLEEIAAPRTATTINPKKQTFYIDLPSLSDIDRDDYDYLPGHFTARKVLSQHSPDRYVIKLASGEKTLVSKAQSLQR